MAYSGYPVILDRSIPSTRRLCEAFMVLSARPEIFPASSRPSLPTGKPKPRICTLVSGENNVALCQPDIFLQTKRRVGIFVVIRQQARSTGGGLRESADDQWESRQATTQTAWRVAGANLCARVIARRGLYWQLTGALRRLYVRFWHCGCGK
jgi:hypothetical protein